jgi:hypothetical protein
VNIVLKLCFEISQDNGKFYCRGRWISELKTSLNLESEGVKGLARNLSERGISCTGG